MKSQPTKFLKTGLFLLFISLMQGCATTTSNYIDPMFSQRNVESIVIMPIVDRRVEKNDSDAIEDRIIKQSEYILKGKGYQIIIEKSFSTSQTVSSEQVADMNAGELTALGPQDAQTLFFIFLEDAQDDKTAVSHISKIELTGSLIDKGLKAEIWRNKGVGTIGSVGVLSSFGPFAKMDNNNAVDWSLIGMLKSFPDKKH